VKKKRRRQRTGDLMLLVPAFVEEAGDFQGVGFRVQGFRVSGCRA